MLKNLLEVPRYTYGALSKYQIGAFSNQLGSSSLSPHPLRRNEAEKLPYLFLDLTEEAIILHDKNGFLEALLLDLKANLMKRGAKRSSSIRGVGIGILNLITSLVKRLILLKIAKSYLRQAEERLNDSGRAFSYHNYPLLP